jgi:hypothetical protein
MLIPILDVAPANESINTLRTFLSWYYGKVWRSFLLSASSNLSRSISARSYSSISMIVSSYLFGSFPEIG